MKKTLLTSILALIFCQVVCFAEPNSADSNSTGRRTPRQSGRFRSERVSIGWENGIQKMTVSIRLTGEANSIWLYPIKCQNEQVKFHLTQNRPRFSGTDARQSAINVLTNINLGVVAGQIWSIPISYYNFERSDGSFDPCAPTAIIDSNDMYVQLIKADSPVQLTEQLKGFGKNVSQSELEKYSKYLNGEYVLLAAWRQTSDSNLTQRGAGRNFRARPAIYAEFPSERPVYYAIQRNGRPPRISLTLTGFWQIDGQDIAGFFDCEQLVGQNEADSQCCRLKKLPFTRFTIRQNENLPQDEILFTAGRLKGMAYADFISNLPCSAMILFGLAAVALVSYFAGGISGLCTYRKWKGFAELGLWNIFTIIAVGIAMAYKKGGISETLRQSKWKPWIFLAVFSLLVIAFSFGLFDILKIPLEK
jgi:hypothetical protein